MITYTSSKESSLSKQRNYNSLLPMLGVLSIPLDLIVDTLLFPADLIAWPLGFSKKFPDLYEDEKSVRQEGARMSKQHLPAEIRPSQQ